MFGKKNKIKFNNHIDTLIGIHTTINGDISFKGGLRIDGHIIGNIVASNEEQSTLVLSNEGSITGKITVTNIIINGTVTGPIFAQGYLELQTQAKVYGDIHYGSLEIHLGASVEGKMIQFDKLNSENSLGSEKMVTLIPATSENQQIATESKNFS